MGNIVIPDQIYQVVVLLFYATLVFDLDLGITFTKVLIHNGI